MFQVGVKEYELLMGVKEQDKEEGKGVSKGDRKADTRK